MTKLELVVDPSVLPLFNPLLEKGAVVSVRTGCSLRDFLCTQLGIADDYLEQRIQTLFLDARPVDDVDKAVVKDGATVALSAAMPGLLGATMRKGGRYAAFRKDISQKKDACGICEAAGQVTLKLFNMVAAEIGERLFKAGVEIDGSDLRGIVERHSQALMCRIHRAYMNGGEIRPAAASLMDLAGQRLRLTITASPSTAAP